MDVRLKHPSISLVIGSTGSGKTTWIQNLILNCKKIINPPPESVIFCFAERQPIYEELKLSAPIPITFCYGLTAELFENINPNTLLIVDDLLNVTDKNLLLDIVHKGSHHRGISLVLVAHNLFDKQLRCISLQAHYLVLLKTVRDFKQIQVLGEQLSIGGKNLLKLYKAATKEPYSYLFLDLRPETDNLLRFRSNIFQDPSVVFVENQYGTAES
jgi:hypothetical protein